MRTKTPLIHWHGRAPIYSVDFHVSGRIVTGGGEPDGGGGVKVRSRTPCLLLSPSREAGNARSYGDATLEIGTERRRPTATQWMWSSLRIYRGMHAPSTRCDLLQPVRSEQNRAACQGQRDLFRLCMTFQVISWQVVAMVRFPIARCSPQASRGEICKLCRGRNNALAMRRTRTGRVVESGPESPVRSSVHRPMSIISRSSFFQGARR